MHNKFLRSLACRGGKVFFLLSCQAHGRSLKPLHSAICGWPSVNWESVSTESQGQNVGARWFSLPSSSFWVQCASRVWPLGKKRWDRGCTPSIYLVRPACLLPRRKLEDTDIVKLGILPGWILCDFFPHQHSVLWEIIIFACLLDYELNSPTLRCGIVFCAHYPVWTLSRTRHLKSGFPFFSDQQFIWILILTGFIFYSLKQLTCSGHALVIIVYWLLLSIGYYVTINVFHSSNVPMAWRIIFLISHLKTLKRRNAEICPKSCIQARTTQGLKSTVWRIQIPNMFPCLEPWECDYGKRGLADLIKVTHWLTLKLEDCPRRYPGRINQIP